MNGMLSMTHSVSEHINSSINNSSYQPNIDDDRKNYSDLSQKNDEESLMINEPEFKPSHILHDDNSREWLRSTLKGEDIKIELEAKSQSSDKELE